MASLPLAALTHYLQAQQIILILCLIAQSRFVLLTHSICTHTVDSFGHLFVNYPQMFPCNFLQENCNN